VTGTEDECLICIVIAHPMTNNAGWAAGAAAATVLSECLDHGVYYVRESLCESHRAKFDRAHARTKAS
jgi:hypothetical protein